MCSVLCSHAADKPTTLVSILVPLSATHSELPLHLLLLLLLLLCCLFASSSDIYEEHLLLTPHGRDTCDFSFLCVVPFLQVKYKEAVKKEASSCLYHRLPETLETQRVKEVTELQSEVHTRTHSLLSVFVSLMFVDKLFFETQNCTFKIAANMLVQLKWC